MVAAPPYRGRPPQSPRRRYPPFGRRVVAIMRDPRRLSNYSGCTATRATVWVVTGRDAWDWVARTPYHLAVVLPPGDDPAAYRWGWLRGHDPLLLVGADADDADRRRTIAAALFRDGVGRVLAGRMLMTAEPARRAAA
jgi:hypothetical protein